MRYFLGHGLLCAAGIYEFLAESGGIYCCISAVSMGSALEERIECAYHYSCCTSKERKLLVAAAPARRE